MVISRGVELQGEVKQFSGSFAQGANSALGRVIPQQSLSEWVAENAEDYGERAYGVRCKPWRSSSGGIKSLPEGRSPNA